MEAFEKAGRWWLPKNQALAGKSFLGTLTWDPHEGATLKAYGEDAELRNVLRSHVGDSLLIHGQLDNLPFVTIPEAMPVSYEPTAINTWRMEISAHKIAKGTAWLDDFDNVPLRGLYCQFSGLDEWIGGSIIRLKHDKDEGTTAQFRSRTIEDFATLGGLRMSFFNGYQSHHGGDGFSVNDVFTAQLEGDSPFTYSDGMRVMTEFQNFLSIALDRPVVLEAVRAKLHSGDAQADDDAVWSTWVDVFEQTSREMATDAARKRNPQRIPFQLDAHGRASAAFIRFHEIAPAIRAALDFFLSYHSAPGSFVNQQFADMVHGLEGLHRGLRGGRYMEQEKYDREVLPVLKAAIPKGLDCSLRSALKKRLEYGNELSLRRRLTDLARAHAESAGKVLGEPKNFAGAVADLRNALAHAIDNADASKSKLMRYFVRLHQARLLFQLELFHQLGFDADFLRGCVPRLQSAGLALRNVGLL